MLMLFRVEKDCSKLTNNNNDTKSDDTQVNTRDPEPEPQSRLRTPMGLKAEVMTAFSVALSWIDTTLNSNQVGGEVITVYTIAVYV